MNDDDIYIYIYTGLVKKGWGKISKKRLPTLHSYHHGDKTKGSKNGNEE
jgi:hypothetical protein